MIFLLFIYMKKKEFKKAEPFLLYKLKRFYECEKKEF